MLTQRDRSKDINSKLRGNVHNCKVCFKSNQEITVQGFKVTHSYQKNVRVSHHMVQKLIKKRSVY